MGRLLGYATVYIDSANETSGLAEMKNLCDPRAFYLKLTELVQLKQGTDLHTSTFVQMLAYEVARGGFLDRHVRVIRKVYGDRRDAMLMARASARSQPSPTPEARWC